METTTVWDEAINLVENFKVEKAIFNCGEFNKLEQKLIEYDIPYVSFKKGEITLEEMKSMMSDDKVKLLTIHASKGLESKRVMLWGNFPIQQPPYMRNSDERKVLYVGATRAIEELIVLN